MNSPEEFIPEAELLVAYLDGELDREDAQRLENRLATDPELRQLLVDHQRAWNLLDDLPQAEVDDKFAQTTVEMIAITAEAESKADEQELRRRRRWLLSAAVAVAAMAAGVGFVWTSSILDADNRRVLGLLPLVQNLETYRWADSVEFLRLLQKEKLFDSAWTPRTAANTSQPNEDDRPKAVGKADSVELESLTPQERREYVARLSGADRLALHRQVEEFQRMSAERQRGLLALHQQLHDDPQADQLKEVLLRYNSWLAALPGERRANLLSLSDEERLAEIKRVLADDERRRIAPADGEVLRRWVYDFVDANEEKLLVLAPDYMRRGLRDSHPDGKRRGLALILMRPDGMEIVDQDAMAPLLERLSPAARQHLVNVNLDRQRQQLREWFPLFMRLRRWEASLLDAPQSRGGGGRRGGFGP